MTAERREALRAGAPLRRGRAILAPELPASTRRSPARSRGRPGGSTEGAGQAALRRESPQGDCLQIPPAAVPPCSRPRGAPDGGFWPREKPFETATLPGLQEYSKDQCGRSLPLLDKKTIISK